MRWLIAGDFAWTDGAVAVGADMANLLASHGHEVRLHFLMGQSGGLRSRVKRGVRVTGHEDMRESLPQLLSILTGWKPDVMICNHSAPSLMIAQQFRSHIGRLGVVVHAPIEKYAPMLASDVQPVVDTYFGVSEEVCEWMRLHGIHESKIVHLPNLVDCEHYHATEPNRSRMFRALPDGSVPLLCVGRMSHEKAPNHMVKAYAAARRTGSLVQLVIVGGPDASASGAGIENTRERERVETERVDEQIAYALGDGLPPVLWTRTMIPNVVPWYRTAARLGGALVLASKFEGLPLVALEAMACGLPVILPDIGGCPDLVQMMRLESGGMAKSGMLYHHRRPGTVPSLDDVVEAVRSFAAFPLSARKRMGEAARQLVVSTYSTQAKGEAYIDTMVRGLEAGSQVQAGVHVGMRSMGEKVLVTGGCGFIGSTLTRALTQRGYHVHILDDLSTGDADNVKDLKGQVTLYPGCITDRAAVEGAMKGCLGVFHLAAMVSVQKSLQDPQRAHRINVGGTRTVLDAAGDRRVVFASSSAIYAGVDPPQREVDEERSWQLSPYAVSKMEGDRMVREAGGVAMRFFNVYGPRQRDDSPYTGVVALFSRALLDDGVVTICGDGLQSRGFVFVGDVVKALLLAMSTPAAGGEAFNVGSLQATTVWDLYSTLAELVPETQATVEMVDARKGEIRHSGAVIDKAKDVLGWQPRIALRDGLRQTLAWYRRG